MASAFILLRILAVIYFCGPCYSQYNGFNNNFNDQGNFIWFDSSMTPKNWRNQFNIPVPQFPARMQTRPNFQRQQQQQSQREKLFIVTDPDTGAMIYIPASTFFERFGGGRPESSPAPPATTPGNPFICDLFTRNCWSSGNQPVSRNQEQKQSQEETEETVTARPSTGGGGGGSSIFGHPNMHQGNFPGPTTFRPFNPSNRVPQTTTEPSIVAAKVPSSASAGANSATKGGGGGSSIFGHPNMHQGNFPGPTTSRPFSPWVPPSETKTKLDVRIGDGESSASSSSSSRSNEKEFSTGRRSKRSPSYGRSGSSSGSSTYSQQSHHDNDWEQGNYPYPHQMPDLAKAQQDFYKFASAAAAAAAANSANFGGSNYPYPGNSFQQSGGFAGSGANFGGSSSSSNYGGYSSPKAGYPSSNSWNNGVSSQSGYNGNGHGYNYNHHYGDMDMKHSTHASQDGMVETRMEGSKCDKNGCRHSSSSSSHYNPSYASSGKSSNGGYASQTSSSNYGGSQGQNRAYETTKYTTTRKPYVYSPPTTTKATTPYYPKARS